MSDTFKNTATVAHIQNTETGLWFCMRLVSVGEEYGANHCLTATESLVEFYDLRYMHTTAKCGTPLGQFVSRYYPYTLLEGIAGHGLTLDGGIPDWTLCATSFHTARTILESWRVVNEFTSHIERG